MESAQLAWIVRSALLYLLVSTCLGQFQQNQFQQNRFQQNQRQQFQRQNRFDQRQNSFNQFDSPQSNQFNQFSSPQSNQFDQQQQRNFQSPGAGGASCPEPNGRFPVASQCDAYIECVDGVGEQKLCPEGLLFNPEARFNYPCGYPIDIQCLSRSNLQPAQPTEDCPHQYGYFKMGDRQNCGQFMNCVEGRSYVFNCPEGLAYNPDSYRCDWPDQVADCDAEAFLGFTCPTQGLSQFLNSEARFYKSPRDCQHYYVCVEGRPRLQNCGEGHAFNELVGTCDAAENVTGCEPPPSFNQDVKQVQLDQPQQNLRSFNNQQNSFNQPQNSFNQQQNFGAFNQPHQQQHQQQQQQHSPRRGQQTFRSNQQNNQFSRQRFSSFKK